MRRPALLLPLVLLVGLLAACDGATHDANDSARSTWEDRRPEAYSFVYRLGGMAGLSTAVVTVIDGRVVTVDPMRNSVGGGPPVTSSPTIDGVFDLVDDALDDADSDDGVSVEYDPDWGFPSSVAVDPIENAIDDEYGFGIADFRVLAGA